MIIIWDQHSTSQLYQGGWSAFDWTAGVFAGLLLAADPIEGYPWLPIKGVGWRSVTGIPWNLIK